MHICTHMHIYLLKYISDIFNIHRNTNKTDINTDT